MLIVLFTFPHSLIGQTTFVDSLKLAAPDASFYERVELKHQIRDYADNILDPNDRIQQVQEIVEVTKEINDSLLVIHAYQVLGHAYDTLGDSLASQRAYEAGQAVATRYGWSLGDYHNPDHRHDLYDYLEIYKDESGQMSFDSIHSNPSIFRLNDSKANVDPDAVYWCKLKLRGHPEEVYNLFLQIATDNFWAGRNSWNQIAAYLVREDGSIESSQSGFALNHEDKAIPFPANFLQFSMQQDEDATLYLRLEGTIEGRVPHAINFRRVSDTWIDDLYGAYEFKRRFRQEDGNPFVSNYIYHHEIIEDSSGTMDINAVSRDWLSLNRKNYLSIQPEVDRV